MVVVVRMRSLGFHRPSSWLIPALLLVTLSAAACDGPQPQVAGPSPAPDNAVEARSTEVGDAAVSVPPEQATAGAAEDEGHYAWPLVAAFGTPTPPGFSLSLDEINARAGVLYAPSYVPDGYVIGSALFFDPPDDHGRTQVSLTYVRHFEEEQKDCLFRVIQFPQGYLRPAETRRYPWVEETIDALPIYRSVTGQASFMFKKYTTWIRVYGQCGLPKDVGGIDLAEMVRVAKSLEPYEGGQ